MDRDHREWRERLSQFSIGDVECQSERTQPPNLAKNECGRRGVWSPIGAHKGSPPTNERRRWMEHSWNAIFCGLVPASLLFADWISCVHICFAPISCLNQSVRCIVRQRGPTSRSRQENPRNAIEIDQSLFLEVVSEGLFQFDADRHALGSFTRFRRPSRSTARGW